MIFVFFWLHGPKFLSTGPVKGQAFDGRPMPAGRATGNGAARTGPRLTSNMDERIDFGKTKCASRARIFLISTRILSNEYILEKQNPFRA